MRLRIERLGSALGAVVHDIDLKTAGDDTFEALNEAIYEHLVLFFRDQWLERDALLSVADRFGAVRVSQPMRFLGGQDPIITHERKPDSPPRTERWHTDEPLSEETPLLGFLNALAAPSVGGGTAWASSYSLFESLSPKMQDFCRGLFGEHKPDATVAYMRQLFGDETGQRVAEAFPLRLHPLVRVHPKTGREHLYLGATMSSIAELTESESDILLNHLRDGLNDVNIQVHWRWSAGDLAIWDQRATMHKAMVEKLAPGERRVLQSFYAYA